MFEHTLLSLKQPASYQHIAQSRHALTKALQALAIDKNLTGNICLCFTELVNNLVEHGSINNDTFFHCQLISTPTNWQLTVKDNGKAFAIDNTISNTNNTNSLANLDAFAENGRGVALIHNLCQHIHYQYLAPLNQYQFSWPKNHSTQLNLLLVEDDHTLRALYKAYLNEAFNIIEANDGEQALSQLQQKSINLVIADINMPVMDGVTLLQTINQTESLAAVPFIFVTGSDDATKLEAINYLGIDSLIHKPVTKEALLKASHRALSRHTQLTNKLNVNLNKQLQALLVPNLPTQVWQHPLSYKMFSANLGGGDFVISQTLANGDVLIAIGDVMGHNSQAKFFAHTYAGYIRGLLLSLVEQPQQQALPTLMAKLNQFVISDNLASQSMLTCQLIYLTEHTIEIVSAGHPAPICLNKQTQTLSSINTQGIALGLLATANYQSETLTLTNNMRIFFYSDGLFDAKLKDETQSALPSRIEQAFKQSAPLSNTAALHHIMDQFSQACCLPASDDALLLILN